jgi:hypothetical protein
MDPRTLSRLLATALLVSALGRAGAAEVYPMWWSDPPGPAPELAVATASAKPSPIRVLTLCLHASHPGKAGEPWVLLRKAPPPPGEEGRPPTWQPYASVRLPEDARKVAVLIVPSTPAQAMAIELSEEAHPWGGVRLVNLTGGPLQGWVGRRAVNLAPGGQMGSETTRVRRTEELVLSAPAPGGGTRVVLSSRVILEPTRRSLVFVAALPDGRVETRALEESRLSAEEEGR